MLEPGGAVALAAALFHGDTFDGDTGDGDAIDGDAVIVVASGGNVDPGLFIDALTRYGV